MQAIVCKTSSRNTSSSSRAALTQALDQIFESLPHGRGWASYPFNTLTLASHYQPIFHADTGRVFGYEALLNATNLTGLQLKPDAVFAISGGNEQELFLDWLCRALHLRNMANIGSNRAERGLLFLNAYPQAAIEDPHYPEVFARMIEFYGVSPRDVVVEILEVGAADDAQLADAVRLYRRLGCKIAIDDFGVGYSNFERMWRLRPDFVKVDRSVLRSATGEQHARLVLSNMVRLIKSCGAQVIVEGIEERAEAKLALDLGADYVQGHFFAKPSMEAFPNELAKTMMHRLIDETIDAGRASFDIAPHVDALKAVAEAIQNGTPFVDATGVFSALPNAVRAYLMEDASNGESRLIVDITEDQAWLNLPTPDSAAWRLRNLAERAIAMPNAVQVTAPLNVDTIPPAPTFTLSVAFEAKGKTFILCGDVLAVEAVRSTRLTEEENRASAAASAPIVRMHM